ncbi:MAG TPA: PilZ domain-containing protein [Bacillales bacterium]|nr:PilZ domain-containing protein [Bacillales bacterium]
MVFITVVNTIVIIAAIAILTSVVMQKNAKEKSSDLQAIPLQPSVHNDSKNRRKYHRIDLTEKSCEVKLLDTENPVLKDRINEVVKGEIANISIGGIKLNSKMDIPVKDDVFIEMNFDLQEEAFCLKGLIVRKEAQVKESHVGYGVQFVGMTESDQQRLGVAINQIELARRQAAVTF